MTGTTAATAVTAATSASTNYATSSSTTSENSSHGALPPRHNSFTLSGFSLKGQIPELDLHRGSYSLWRSRLERKLAIYQVLDHVHTDVTRPGDPEWLAVEAIIQSWLLEVLSLDLQATIHAASASARSIWLAVESIFRNNGMTRAMILTKAFHLTKQLDHPLSVYLAELKAISDELRDLGYPLSTHTLLIQLLSGLHQHHEIVGKLIQQDAETLTFAAAVDKLSMDEKMSGNAPTGPTTATALLSYRPRVPAPAPTHGGQGTFGSPGSPSPNQGNQKRKRFSNHGGYKQRLHLAGVAASDAAAAHLD
ncbi:hypothetical protein QYE76_027319 [Lolium multiflorum]|uniref:Retrotransposon Copia-like N-terminal domain-containing protein n=1 Tax=Lolium multiflorum TaxID=4521 RepID=A0AAD8QIX5_LOLMU|nr:hypothetical protein QYE76_027319 [Lolium multiflorum]